MSKKCIRYHSIGPYELRVTWEVNTSHVDGARYSTPSDLTSKYIQFIDVLVQVMVWQCLEAKSVCKEQQNRTPYLGAGFRGAHNSCIEKA